MTAPPTPTRVVAPVSPMQGIPTLDGRKVDKGEGLQTGWLAKLWKAFDEGRAYPMLAASHIERNDRV